MGRLFKALGVILLLLAAAAAAIYFTGNVPTVIVWLSQPRHGWDPSLKAPPPDYAQADAWAAMPGKDSLALFVPEGVENTDGMRAVDVFFVHPTGYLNGGEWNSPMNPNSRTEENTKWMLVNQASAYNGCCNVYAPRYREASIFRYFTAPPDIAEKTMDLAYSDVERAFQYFLDHTEGRPFVIASHSQGTTHAFRLIKERIDATPLAGRLVAAYLIGSQVTNEEADALKTVPVCNTPTQTGCLVHWAAWGDGGTPPKEMTNKLVCVNPLSWTRNGGRADATLHQGAVPASGQFSMKMWGDDGAQGTEFKPLGAPVKAWTWAECRDGLLFVKDQAGSAFAALAFPDKNYHGLDYPLFHMDIRANAQARVAAYFQSVGTAQPGAAAP